MGIFGKIKNILFEPDDEEIIEDMHIYTKDEVKKEEKTKEEHGTIQQVAVEEPPIKTTNTSHFSNVKRDIDIDYEDKKVLDEVPGAMEAMKSAAVEQSRVLPKTEEVKPLRPSPFQSFDEKEFERVNSRVAKNEQEHNKLKKENRMPDMAQQAANNYRKANSLFSSTMTEESRVEEKEEPVRVGKKPFRPSPVISPVYGILDKNYHKDDIVDKKDGMKREKIVKPINSEEKKSEDNDTAEVDIDSVRLKAYGTLEDIETEMQDQTVNDNENIDDVDKDIVLEDVKPDVIEADIDNITDNDDTDANNIHNNYEDEIDDDLTLGDLINANNTVSEAKIDEISVEDELETEFESTNNATYEIKKPVEEEEKKEPVRPRLLDDMEKTSTLQILDDIEKELNSIKPITKDVNNTQDEDMKEKIEKSETLENDLFNLIDSMYEQGEEDDND